MVRPHLWGCGSLPLGTVCNLKLIPREQDPAQRKKARWLYSWVATRFTLAFAFTHQHAISHSCHEPERRNGHGLAWPQPNGRLPWMSPNIWSLSWHTAVVPQIQEIYTHEDTSVHFQTCSTADMRYLHARKHKCTLIERNLEGRLRKDTNSTIFLMFLQPYSFGSYTAF